MSLLWCKELINIKVEADIGADPFWCAVCNYNLDKMKFSDSLKEQLRLWIDEYGTWIDWESDNVIADVANIENQHNELGVRLTEEVNDSVVCG